MMEKKDFSVIICGQITIDDIVRMDRPVLMDSPGGDGIYQLSGAYMWQRDSIGFVTRKGNDFDMDTLRKATKGTVDLSGVTDVPDMANIHIFAIFDRAGNRYFINQRWSGKNPEMEPHSAADFPDRYRGATRAISVAALPFPWGAGFLQGLPDDGTIIAVDPHFDSMYEDNRPIWIDLFKKITVWLPSEDELIRFFSIPAQEKVENYIPYLKKITDYGVRVCLVKLGGRGSLVYDRTTDRAWHVPAYAKSKVVDVTGCGDTFCGGFISGYLQNEDPLEGAICGSVSASFCIDHYGCMKTFEVTKEQATARYDEFKAGLDLEKCRLR